MSGLPGRIRGFSLVSFLNHCDTKSHLVILLIPSLISLDYRRIRLWPSYWTDERKSSRCWWRTGLVIWVLSLTLVGCGVAASSMPPPAQGVTPDSAAKLNVVATTTILADLARNVGGDLISVTTLVPPGADVHAFQTTPSAGIAIDQAGVIISNGLGLDGFLDPVLESSRRFSAVRVVAAQGLDPPVFIGVGGHLGEDANPAGGTGGGLQSSGNHEGANPHLWLDPMLAIHYVERIRDGLVEADPANSATYGSNAEAYIRQLRALDQQIAQTLSRVPPERRHLVTYHDAFVYLIRRYDWRASALAPDDARDPTPGSIIAVMRQIREEGIPAVFAEPQFTSDVLRRAAGDAGVGVGTVHSLPNDDLPTYLDMMRYNASTMAEYLK